MDKIKFVVKRQIQLEKKQQIYKKQEKPKRECRDRLTWYGTKVVKEPCRPGKLDPQGYPGSNPGRGAITIFLMFKYKIKEIIEKCG